MHKLNFTIFYLTINMILEFFYQYILYRHVIFDFNKYLKNEIRKYIQLYSSFILTIYIILYVSNVELSYFKYIPFVFLIITYLETSSVITENGIRVKKVYKNIITWGQIQSYRIIDDLSSEKFRIVIIYNVKNSTSLENHEIIFDRKDKFEVEQILCSMKSLFNKEDLIPMHKFIYFKRFLLGFILITYSIFIFTDIDIFV